MLQLAVTTVTAATLIWTWIVPESPKWNLSSNRKVEALKEAMNLAKKNKDESFFEEFHKLDLASKPAACEDVAAIESPSVPTRMIDLFLHRILLKHTLIMFCVWFSITMSYFGILLYMPGLPGGRHLNFMISGLFETVGVVITYFLLSSSLGRKYSMIVLQYASVGFCVALTALVNLDQSDGTWIGPLLTVVAVTGKSLLGAAFTGMFIYGAELFPTILRGSAIGILGFAARLGGLLSPQLMLLVS